MGAVVSHCAHAAARDLRRGFLVVAVHLSTFGAAVWLWSSLLDHPPAQNMQATLAGLFSTVQMGLLGALITLARVRSTPRTRSPRSHGAGRRCRTSSLGGAIMWIPGCIVFLAVAMLGLGRLFADASLRPVRP